MSLNFDGYGEKPEHPFREGIDIELRQSTYSTMLFSPSRYGLSDMDGYRDLPSYAMMRGTLVHDLIEQHINGVPYMQLIISDFIKERLVHLSHEDGFDVYGVADEPTIDQMVDEARQAFVTWHSSFWEPEGQYLDALMVEEKVWRPLGVIPETGQGVWVHGTPDFVVSRDGIPEGFDWKTASRGWSEAKFYSYVQWPFYTWLLQDAYCPDLDLNWTALVWDASKNKWDRFELPSENKYGDWIEMNPEYVEATMRNAWQMARCIAFDVYPAIPLSTHGPWGQVRPWYNRAAYNPAWDIDPFKYLLDGKNDETAGIEWSA